jgi:CMP-N,N'-diacetyllegionaminic acid synthase
MRFLAVIPARGGSKGIPRKNLHSLAGKPLIGWTIGAARAAKSLDRIIVSTDDEEIATTARALGAEAIMRPAELAQDKTPTLPVLQHVVAFLASTGYSPDAVMTLQPTSPLRTALHIDEAAALFAADNSADSLVSTVNVPHVFHPLSIMRRDPDGYLKPYLDGDMPLRRQDKQDVFARNGAAIYITRINRLPEYVFGGRLIGYDMAPECSVDIDGPQDLIEAERLLKFK